MTRMSPADFESRYVENLDPWGYTDSQYERRKYEATLAACGPGPFARALELGGSIGVFTAMLAPRCRRLVTLDAAPTAVSAASERLQPFPHVEPRLGVIPGDLPRGPFDVVVASEILYYLDRGELAGTLRSLESSLAAGGRLVAVHWRPPGPERPLDAETVHRILVGEPWLRPLSCGHTRDYLLDVLVRR